MKRSSTFFGIVLIAALSLMGFANSSRGQDVEPPTVLSAVFDNLNREIIVRYSEPMDTGSAFEPGNYEVILPSGESRFPVFAVQEDAAGTLFRVFLEAAAAPGSTLSVFFVTDLAGNLLNPNPTILLIQGPPDTTRPTVVSAVFANVNNAIIVTFSERMHQAQAEEPGNYLVTGPSGDPLEITSITQHNPAGTQYRLNLIAAAGSGSELTVFEVSDFSMNVIDPNPTTIPIQDAADATPPTVLSATVGDFTTSNTIVSVTFSEPMHPGQVFEPGNYLVTGPSGEILPIAFITQQDAAGAQYRLHLSAVVISGSQLTVSGLSDLALNVIDPNPTTLPILGGAAGGDTTPPTVSATVSTSLLTPPNHKFRDVGLTVAANDNVTANPTISIRVLSDEALSDRDVDYTNGVLLLRATRDGGGDGRVYLIVVTATDEAGNAASTCTTVVVPHSNSSAAIANVQAQAAALCH